MAGNIHLNAHADIYRQLGIEFLRQVAVGRNGAVFKKVIEILDSAIEVVNQEHNICLASVNAGEKRT